MKFHVSATVLLVLLFNVQARAQDVPPVAGVEVNAAGGASAGQAPLPATQPAPGPSQLKVHGQPSAHGELPLSQITGNPLMPTKNAKVVRNPAVLGGAAGLNRGGGGDQLLAIAPKSGGSTSSARPTLYFHLSKPVPGEVVATLTKGEEPEPAKEWKLSNLDAGIHALTLTDADPALEIDAKYTWVVEVKQHSSASKNPSVQGKLVRVRVAPDIADLSPADRLVRFADAGLYYDAVDELLRDPSAHSGAERAFNYRAEFRQVLELQRTRHAPTTSLR